MSAEATSPECAPVTNAEEPAPKQAPAPVAEEPAPRQAPAPSLKRAAEDQGDRLSRRLCTVKGEHVRDAYSFFNMRVFNPARKVYGSEKVLVAVKAEGAALFAKWVKISSKFPESDLRKYFVEKPSQGCYIEALERRFDENEYDDIEYYVEVDGSDSISEKKVKFSKILLKEKPALYELNGFFEFHNTPFYYPQYSRFFAVDMRKFYGITSTDEIPAACVFRFDHHYDRGVDFEDQEMIIKTTLIRFYGPPAFDGKVEEIGHEVFIGLLPSQVHRFEQDPKTLLFHKSA